MCFVFWRCVLLEPLTNMGVYSGRKNVRWSFILMSFCLYPMKLSHLQATLRIRITF